MVAGAVRFNRSYVIPKGAPKPADGRRNHVAQALPVVSVPENGETPFREMFDHFPYRVNVSTVNGMMIYANRLFMEGTLQGVSEEALGQYNILTSRT